MLNVVMRVRALVRNDEGQDLIEYALLAGLLSLVCVAAIGFAGDEVLRVWNSIVTALKTV